MPTCCATLPMTATAPSVVAKSDRPRSTRCKTSQPTSCATRIRIPSMARGPASSVVFGRSRDPDERLDVDHVSRALVGEVGANRCREIEQCAVGLRQVSTRPRRSRRLSTVGAASRCSTQTYLPRCSQTIGRNRLQQDASLNYGVYSDSTQLDGGTVARRASVADACRLQACRRLVTHPFDSPIQPEKLVSEEPLPTPRHHPYAGTMQRGARCSETFPQPRKSLTRAFARASVSEGGLEPPRP